MKLKKVLRLILEMPYSPDDEEMADQPLENIRNEKRKDNSDAEEEVKNDNSVNNNLTNQSNEVRQP
jgi:hypothetical protein